MKDHLIFDASDIDTVNATDSVGAYVRSSKSGALITNHSRLKGAPAGFSFVDGDVTPGSDSIAETSHGLFTGDKVRLTTSGTLPAGLATATDYWVIRVDANNFKLASSAYNAEWGIPVDITAAAGGGTHNVVGQDEDVRALDVWMMNPSVIIDDGGSSISIDDNGGSITVDANNLDIRDLVYTQDSVTAYQGTSPWVIGDGGGSITVDGSVSITGTVAVTQSTSPWVVSATDLDIRDLSHTQDSIKIGDGTDFLAINADGSINVNADISVTNGHEKAEDAAHVSGDIGSYVLAVRQDTLANSVSADGDYASLKVDALGALYVNMTNSISVNDAALANSAILSSANVLNVADTAEAVVGSALSNRKYLWVYNIANTKVFIGGASVSAANGFPVSPGSYMELRAGAAVPVNFVGDAGKTPEIRVLELS